MDFQVKNVEYKRNVMEEDKKRLCGYRFKGEDLIIIWYYINLISLKIMYL